MNTEREHLTNEKLFEKFESPFNLVNYAISYAKNLVDRGEEHSNLASDVIELIMEGEDELDDAAVGREAAVEKAQALVK